MPSARLVTVLVLESVVNLCVHLILVLIPEIDCVSELCLGTLIVCLKKLVFLSIPELLLVDKNSYLY